MHCTGKTVRYSEVSAIRSVRYWEVFKVQYIWEAQLVHIAHCPLYGRCPLFGVSAKRGSTVLGRFATPLNVSLINFEVLEVVTGPPIASLLSGSTVGPE